MALATALDALDHDDRRGALDALLDTWRETRSPAIADAIDLVSDDLVRALPRIEGKTRAAFQARWLEVASRADAAELGTLLAALDVEPCTNMRDRIDRLAVRPHDPRIARALGAFMSRRPCTCTSTPNSPMWTQIFKLVTALGDVHIRPVLSLHTTPLSRGGFFELLATRATKALESLAEPAALARAEASLLARITAKLLP